MSVKADGKPGGADQALQVNSKGAFGPNAVDLATQAELDAHAADTTSVHGITDTSALVLTSDARLSDARTPTAHATSHQHSGADEVATATPAANAIPKAGAGGTLADGWLSAAIARITDLAAYAQLAVANVFTAAQAITVVDAATNTTLALATLGHNSSGTPLADFGAALHFQLKSSTTADQDAARVFAFWTDATHATRTSALSFSTVNSGTLAERVRITGAGNVGIGVVPSVKFDISGEILRLGHTASPYIHINTTSGANKRGGIKFLQSSTALFEMGTDFSANDTRDFYLYDNVAGGTRIYIDASGNVQVGTNGGSLQSPRSGGTAVFALDTSGVGGNIQIANNGTATPFGNVNNFGGLILVNETQTFGSVGLFITGGAAIAEIADPGSKYTAVSGSASSINVYLNASVVTIENKTGSTITINVMALRNRAAN